MVKNAKLEEYAKWKTKPEKEDYLEHADTHQRRLWTKLRSGCLELRVETGRWERVSVGGRQVPVPAGGDAVADGRRRAQSGDGGLWRG